MCVFFFKKNYGKSYAFTQKKGKTKYQVIGDGVVVADISTVIFTMKIFTLSCRTKYVHYFNASVVIYL